MSEVSLEEQEWNCQLHISALQVPFRAVLRKFGCAPEKAVRPEASARLQEDCLHWETVLSRSQPINQSCAGAVGVHKEWMGQPAEKGVPDGTPPEHAARSDLAPLPLTVYFPLPVTVFPHHPMRSLFLHVSALNDDEYTLFTSSFADLVASDAPLPTDDDFEKHRVAIREARAWLRGRYADLPVTDLDEVRLSPLRRTYSFLTTAT